MLSGYNERLKELREKMARRGQLESMLCELRAQEKALAGRVGALARELDMEQEDVERLSGGFRSIYYAILGKKEEMLEKERADVLKASMKFETAKKELETVQQEIFRLDWEAGSIRQYEREYQAVLQEKIEAMKEMTVYFDKIAELEEKQGYLAIQLREVGEAMEAGRRVLGQIDRIEASLSSAEGWGTWDLFGGGVLADIAKYSHLDAAQAGAQQLNSLLRRFKTELADITFIPICACRRTDSCALRTGFSMASSWTGRCFRAYRNQRKA